MIKYKSTRGDDITRYTFSEAILQGIATDGGLLVPEEIPHLSLLRVQELVEKSYQERALFILKLFQTDFTEDLLKPHINQAYGKNFDTPAIAPIVHLKDTQYLLELWHGPTAAFKDIALQLMPFFFSEAVKKQHKHYIILVATSGDTGKAALEGYRDKENISIVVFYPHKRVSALQELQMATQEGNNVGVYAAEGNFDSVQSAVKQTFTDTAFQENLLSNHNVVLSSANSINWGRLLPQIIYYVSAYADMLKQKIVILGEPVDIVVPSGNFGNMLAAFYAKSMGLPLRKLVCASNENNVLTEFLQTGVYNSASRSLVQTPSPSMDILIASNVERLLYLLTTNTSQVAGWMHDLQIGKQFAVDDQTRQKLHETFASDWVSNKESLQTVKEIYDQTGYLMDPHTAVAQRVGQRYLQKNGNKTPLIICSTAHWSKFVKDIYPLFNQTSVQSIDEFEMLDSVLEHTSDTHVPESIHGLKQKVIRFTEVCHADKEAVQKVILNFLQTKTAAL